MTFYFYDLETSGINPRAQRIMQFAGQRTDENFNPIGEPQNWIVKLTDEILPDPDAVLITGITPQKTLEEGYTEVEFLKLVQQEVCQPDTIITGFNTIRFDDEFMRATFWRNFYDPYEWQWQNGCSRWDLLDVTRMVRALRPDGIEWPFQPARREGLSEHGVLVAPQEGDQNEAVMVPSNRLELLTAANGLDHENAHDALNDVLATIAVAKLMKEKQPKMFNYLLNMRSKKQLAELINTQDPQPFVYCSGRYSTKWLKTSAVLPIGQTENGAVLVYDLRQNPQDLSELTDEELIEQAFSRNAETKILPVKPLKLNSCPAVAPLGVLDNATQVRIDLTMQTIEQNYRLLRSMPELANRITQLHAQMTSQRTAQYAQEADPDFRLYDGFIGDKDKTKMRAVRAAVGSEVAELDLSFDDTRLADLLPRYIARNFPQQMGTHYRETWEVYRQKRIIDGVRGQLSLADFANRLNELAVERSDERSQFLLQELQLYAEGIAPEVNT